MPPGRTIAIHSQVMRHDQLDEYVATGLEPSMFTIHTYLFGDTHLANFGEERAFGISPMRSAIDKGLRPTNHSDYPITPINPLMLMWTAVSRTTLAGVVLGENERISAREALRSVTIDAAYEHRTEHDRGSIEIGKLADFAVLSDNPLDQHPRRHQGHRSAAHVQARRHRPSRPHDQTRRARRSRSVARLGFVGTARCGSTPLRSRRSSRSPSPAPPKQPTSHCNNTAIALAGADLGMSAAERSFGASVGTLALAASILTVGSLGDRHGRRRLLEWCCVALVIGGIVTAAAPGFATYVVGRTLTGVGLAGTLALSMALIRSVAADSVRTRRPSTSPAKSVSRYRSP